MKKFNRGIGAFAMACIISIQAAAFSSPYSVEAATARQVEGLGRGLTVTALAKGTLVSWRYLGTDAEDTSFKLYRNSQLIYTSNKGMATCYKDNDGSADSSYSLEVYRGGSATASEKEKAEYILGYDSAAKGGYFDMELDVPTDSRLGAVYTPNDASVADLDGDGAYELIIKWDPNNSQDNSKPGLTSNVIIDAYKLEAGDASRLWRIDLGQNIRAGAHYTQFMVYDFDGDGVSEMVCKTAPGSKDGSGAYVSKASSISDIKNTANNTKAYANSSGYILSGDEYLTLFDGKTGKALDTIYYEPGRGNVSDWGDNYGNRVDRFLAGVAYLNGKTPSAVMCRGYYTRSVLVTYNVVNKKLAKQWTFDTNSSGNSEYAGQGNHNLVCADVDSDGYDEIVYGSMTVDHNGKGLYNTKLGHGDALHVGDFMPSRSGLEVYQVHEETFGASLRDAKTGKIIKRWNASDDTGRGIADNIIAGNSEAEFCSSADNVVYNSSGTKVTDWSNITKWGQNSLIYWDGDLEREVLDRVMIDDYPNGRIFTGQNVSYNNASKSNMCITADIFGDWREELIAPLSNGSGVRVYATTYETDYRIYTLMHNTQYRCGVAAENVSYNQPPHVDYWLGTGSALPSQPNVYMTGDIKQEISFKAELTGDNIAEGTYTSGFTAGDKFNMVATEAGPIIVSQSSSAKQVGDKTISKYINLKIKGSPTTNAIEISAKEAGDLYIGVLSGNATAARNLSVYNSSGTRIGLVDAPVSGTEKVDLQKVTLTEAGTYYIYSTAGSVFIYYLGSTAELNTFKTQATTQTTTEKTTESTTKATESTTEVTTATSKPMPAGGASHSFNNGTDSSFYTITGNLSASYGSVRYNDENITSCLKMESSTNISFNTQQNGRFTMVFNSTSAGKTVKLDGKKYTIPSDGILTAALAPGSHTLAKGDGSSYLFYMNMLEEAEEKTTESTTKATESTTEATTDLSTDSIMVKAVNNTYSFMGLKGILTKNSSYGGAYCQVTGTAAGDGENYVAFNNDGYAYVADSDTGLTSVLILPVADTGNRITIGGSFMLPTANNNWSFLQVHGSKKDGSLSEIVGIRTSEGFYQVRAMGNSNKLYNTQAGVKANEPVSYTFVIDKANGKAYLTIGENTVSVDIECKEVKEIRFVTATGIRNIYAGETWSYSKLLGDADNNGVLTYEDAALILKISSGINCNADTFLADYNNDGAVNLTDGIKLLSEL